MNSGRSSYLSDIPVISVADRGQGSSFGSQNNSRFGSLLSGNNPYDDISISSYGWNGKPSGSQVAINQQNQYLKNASNEEIKSLQGEVGRLSRMLAESESMNEKLKSALVDSAGYEKQMSGTIQTMEDALRKLMSWVEKARAVTEDRVQNVLTGALSGSVEENDFDTALGVMPTIETILSMTNNHQLPSSFSGLCIAVKGLTDVSLRLAPSITSFAAAKMERIHYESDQLNSQKAELRQQLLRLNEMEAIIEGRRAAIKDWVQRLEATATEGLNEMGRLELPECISVYSTLAPLGQNVTEEQLIERAIKEVEFMKTGFRAIVSRIEGNLANNTKSVQTSPPQNSMSLVPSPTTMRSQHSSRVNEVDAMQRQRAYNRLSGISSFEQRTKNLGKLGEIPLSNKIDDQSIVEYLRTRLKETEVSRDQLQSKLLSMTKSWSGDDTPSSSSSASVSKLNTDRYQGDKSVGPATRMLSEIGWNE